MGSSQGLQERRRTEYMRGLSSIYQTDPIVDAVSATATLMETEAGVGNFPGRLKSDFSSAGQ